MCRFIESIRWEKGVMPLIGLHQQRFEKTQTKAFGRIMHASLHEIISQENTLRENKYTGKYKCRIVYDDQNVSVAFIPYRQAEIDHLKIVTDNQIEYYFKFENRTCFDRLKSGLNKRTDILIIKNNMVTDTSFTNIALQDGTRWFTPAIPLLEGVQRNFLINEGIIFPEEIRLNDLHHFKKIKLFNAMINWDEAPVLEIP